MIINFKLKNYGSYKDEQILDFTKKSKEKSGIKFVNKIKNVEILNVAGLVGVNGSGKSLLIEGLDFMKKMVLNSQNNNINSDIEYNDFLNDTLRLKPIEFEITFVTENKKYIYGFSYTNQKIIREYLRFYDTQKPTEVFFRNNEKYKFNVRYERELKPLSHSVIPQTLMLSRAVQMNSKSLKPVFDFFTRIFTVDEILNKELDFSLLNNDKLKKDLLEKLYFADFSIHDLELIKGLQREIKSIKIQNNYSTNNPEVEEKGIMELVLIHKHNNKDLKINFDTESRGTQDFIHIFYNLLKLPEGYYNVI